MHSQQYQTYPGRDGMRDGVTLIAQPTPHPQSVQFIQNSDSSESKIHVLVAALLSPATRESALLELSKRREQHDDLARVLWASFGVMPCLLQEIVAVYPTLTPPTLTAHTSNRVCNALALLQCVASHPETRVLFLNGTRKSISNIYL